MSDGGRPSWPQPQQPEPGSTTEPVAAARPSWTTVAPSSRAIDVKLVIAVLIGLVSVTGAVVAWRSALLAERATDKDRQAVAETVLVSQAATNREIIEQDAAARFADHLAARTSALRLEQDRQELVANLGHLAPRARRTFVVHGEPEASFALRDALAAAGFRDVVVPVEGESYELAL